jgi:hypothetical protein
MNLSLFRSSKLTILSFSVLGSASLLLAGGSAKAIPSTRVNPIYTPVFTTVWGDEIQYKLPSGSPDQSVGYWFETDKDDIRVNALGFPAFNQSWGPSNSYIVRLWKYDPNGYTEIANATFVYAPLDPITNLNPLYTFKDGYYWQDVPVVSLGAKSNADPDVIFATAASGTYNENNGVPYLMGGTGSFTSGVVTFDSNGISNATEVGIFPFPLNTISSPSFGIFNPNVSYETVPGPLPLLGAGVAFGYARRIRNRVRL